MKIIILRHLESEKNINKNFSSDKDEYTLTKFGATSGVPLAIAIKNYVNNHKLFCSKIHIAKSERARQTANIIKTYLQEVEIIEWDNLRSAKSGLAGLSEKEAEKTNPLFIEQLRLFRCGLFNSYNFSNTSQREDKREFEQRVFDTFNQIMQYDQESLKIIIVHHSTLTAIMIYFARLFYDYPKDFYGKVDCELGHYYIIDLDTKTIDFCNASWQEMR